MKIVGLNFDIYWKDKKTNFRQIEDYLDMIEADIFVLPEMFSTGFCMEAEEIADKENESLEWMKSFSKRKKTAIAGSVSVFESGNFYNRFYFVKPNGDVTFYDKRHLFSYAGEDKIYTKGKERVVVEYLGVRFLLQICYDLRFPIFSRNRMDYDAILYVANWPKTRIDEWYALLKSRAIENQSYVFGVNRIGVDGNNIPYEASSYCFRYDGELISTTDKNIISANIDIVDLHIFRDDFQFLKDADDFSFY